MSSEFVTKRLPLAVFLHASSALRYLRIEPSEQDRKMRFLFRDDEKQGAQLEIQFERGATVSAKDLFASQTFLRRQISEAENRRINGERSHVNLVSTRF